MSETTTEKTIKPIKWSYSRVSTYQGCPLKYYYQYVNKFDSSEKVNTVLADKGSVLHKTVEKYTTGMSREDLLKLLHERCESYHIIDDDPEAVKLDGSPKYTEEEKVNVFNETAGIDRFLLFWDKKVRPLEEEGYKVQQEIDYNMEINGNLFTGALDLLIEAPEGSDKITYIYDYKTGASITASTYKKQQILYAYMFGKDKGWDIEKTAKLVKLYIFGPLSKQEKPITQEDKMLASVKEIKYTAEEMKEIIDNYTTTIAEIGLINWADANFDMLGTESFACKWCQFCGSIGNRSGFSGCKATYDLGYRSPAGVTFFPHKSNH